jgi:malonyl CoA-acyl carrier protein transacylase/phosphopantetheinyl transferase
VNTVLEPPGVAIAGSIADRPTAPVWETEVFVLRGEDRKVLWQKVQTLSAYLERSSGVALKDLAFTLNTALPAGGCRLAVVAGNMADLRNRLARAGERLADPACKQIKDGVGIYYFGEPLSPQGRLAFLFPGEGAQYLNMLRDLCVLFPEVRDCFAAADRMAAALGQPERSLSRVLFVSPEEQDPAEKELRQLGNAMFSVLIADWAIHQLLCRLGVQPDAVAGHSMGELAALCAANCLEMDETLLPRIIATLDALQEQEGKGGSDAVLLAVGAGRQALSEVIAQGGPGVHLAMDNCPHQSVVVGLPGPMAVVEAELQRRQVLCERLPFRRPYHTPLFEPSLPDLDRMFDTTTFRAPRTPTYSCTTGRLFPADPVEVRRLTVAHWAAPAEFTQMIENMYADGVRLFVEAGPRGNLSAFVEDILRGRSFAALPANVQRRSGVTQLNHLVGQLAAHHVPLQLDALYSGREGQLVPWQAPATGNRRGAILAQYLEVMGQFLDTQREVMEQFLSRNHQTRPAGGAEPAREPRVATRPMLGEIVRLEPGKEAVMRRRLDLAEDHFAAEHTIGGRTVSKMAPQQHGLPVMPMTFSLEMMAELASLLVTGQVVIGFEGVRLLRWLAFDDEDPTTVEVTARVLSATNGGEEATRRVAVEVRDLGNAARPGDARWVAVQGTVLLDDHYPAAPVAGELSLSQERPSRISLEVLYRNLFHGPQLQGVLSTTRIGAEGVEGEVQVLPRSDLFRSHSDPDLLTDPVLLDVAMHPLVSWHLEQPNQAGRILLPIELGSLTLFGPRPAVGTRFRSRGRTDDFSARHYTHTVEVIASDGRLWCRLTAMKYWRMYVPFCEVNFHGPKDEYFLSGEWPAASGPPMAGEGLRVPACCMRLDAPPDLQQHVIRTATARVTLTPAELQQFRRLKGPESKLSEWLFGRIAAKDAVRRLWWQRHGERLFPADIEIETDAHGRPVARRRGATAGETLPAVSLAHTDGLAIGLAAFGPHVGVDVERVKPRGDGFEEIAFDDAERRLLGGFGPARDEGNARFWCAKEAVAKALGRGLIEGPRSLSVRTVDVATGRTGVVLGPALAEAFPQWRDALLTAWTLREKDVVVATTYCERDPA